MTTRPDMLSAEEWDLVSGLRAIPAGVARAELIDSIRDLVNSTGVCCAEAQADGVPCVTVDMECARCPRATGVLTRLRAKATALWGVPSAHQR